MRKLTSSVYTFENLIQNNFQYVDKTEYIWTLVEPGREMFFLSRPRRFGKSLTLSTLKAVFQGKKELFQGLAIYGKPYDWKPYPVIHLDLNGWNLASPVDLKRCLRGLIRESAEDHHVRIQSGEQDEMFRDLVRVLSEKDPAVILIDEYDKPILNNLGKPHAREILNLLKSFYSVIKSFESRLRFVFITGVSKFSHVSLFSDLNNLTDITMDARFATMLGYTQEELDTQFADRIQAVADEQGVRQDVLKAKIKEWYDGFRFHAKSQPVYNPVSIAKFFESGGEFANYWFATGTPSFLMEIAKQTDFNFETANKLPVSAISFDAYEVSSIDPVTLLLQTGYYTIKSTETRFDTLLYYLDFPNKEVAESFTTYLLHSYANKTKTAVVNFCFSLSCALLENKLDEVRKLLETFFAGVPFTIHKKSEATFQSIFYAVFRLLGYNIEAESCTNDGRIDAVVQTDSHVYLFEFKLDKDDTALLQMVEKEYFRKYLCSTKQIVLVGVNFDSQSGQLLDWKTMNVKV